MGSLIVTTLDWVPEMPRGGSAIFGLHGRVRKPISTTPSERSLSMDVRPIICRVSHLARFRS